MFKRRCPEKENEALQWVAKVVGESLPVGAKLEPYLRDGQILCRLINVLSPGSVEKIHSQGTQFRMMENINNFTEAARRYGVPNHDLFQTVDLWEGKDPDQVVDTLFALGRTTYQHPEWQGPHLGPRPAEKQKREFTEEQLRMGEAVIGLQAGSNKGATQAGQNFGAARRVIIGK